MSLVQITDLARLPVVDLDTGDVLGQVATWVVSPKDQKVLAYVLQRFSWLGGAKVILAMDVTEYAPKMLVVRTPEAIISPREVVGLPELVDRGVSITGFAAEDETGRALGKISDLAFDITSGQVQRYYVQPTNDVLGIQNDLILSREQVVGVEDHRVIFAITAAPIQAKTIARSAESG